MVGEIESKGKLGTWHGLDLVLSLLSEVLHNVLCTGNGGESNAKNAGLKKIGRDLGGEKKASGEATGFKRSPPS